MTIAQGYCGLPLPLDPVELDVDGMEDSRGVRFFGKASLQPNGKWRCLADVWGNLCIVEATVTFGDVTPNEK